MNYATISFPFLFRESPRTGFTLVETLTVLALMAMLLPLILTGGIAMYERSLARTDRTLLVAALREARAQALSGICTAPSCAAEPASALSPRGVYISARGITIFEGSSYATRASSADVFIPFSTPETVSGTQEIAFAPLSADVSSLDTYGDTTLPFTLVLTDSDHRTETVVVNSLGCITSSSI